MNAKGTQTQHNYEYDQRLKSLINDTITKNRRCISFTKTEKTKPTEILWYSL